MDETNHSRKDGEHCRMNRCFHDLADTKAELNLVLLDHQRTQKDWGWQVLRTQNTDKCIAFIKGAYTGFSTHTQNKSRAPKEGRHCGQNTDKCHLPSKGQAL